jgi:hypothetical protein
MAWATCPICKKRFWGGGPKSASSSRDRHKRESHGANRLKKARLRHERDARYAKTRRVQAKVLTSTSTQRLRAFVICPIRREISGQMFSDTRLHFVEKGWASSQIIRMEGYDRTTQRFEQVGSHRTLMMFFIQVFLPKLSKLFETSDIDAAFWVEDHSVVVLHGARLFGFALCCMTAMRRRSI